MSPTDLPRLPQIPSPAGNRKHHVLTPKLLKQNPQQAANTPKQTKGPGTALSTPQTSSRPNPPHSTSVGAHLRGSAQGLSWEGGSFFIFKIFSAKKTANDIQTSQALFRDRVQACRVTIQGWNCFSGASSL